MNRTSSTSVIFKSSKLSTTVNDNKGNDISTQFNLKNCDKASQKNIFKSKDKNLLSNTKIYDPIKTEFLYYSATLKEIAPKLTNENDRHLIIPWIKKMFRPEYHSSVLRQKRNRYLLFMTLSILNDEIYNILKTTPPLGAVPDIESLPEVDIERAEWENDDTWKWALLGLPVDKRRMKCSYHTSIKECDEDHKLNQIFDEEFKYLLYLIYPYYILIQNKNDKPKIKAWIEILCTIHSNSCSTMRGIRNDYIMALFGYLQEMRVTGPFKHHPAQTPLKPLGQWAKFDAERPPFLDLTHGEIDEFMKTQPFPTDGAVCYVGVTGDPELQINGFGDR